MDINQFIQKYRQVKIITPFMTTSFTPHVVCKDGFTMSVQAGGHLLSWPKKITDHYESAEVGYPSEGQSLLTKYQDDSGEVYGYVPCSIIDEIIKDHGGIDQSKIKTELDL